MKPSFVVGDAKFCSTEYRLFKLPKERVGPKQVTYKGSITGCEKELVFDHQTIFKVRGYVGSPSMVLDSLN